jgi:hypothetical protein
MTLATALCVAMTIVSAGGCASGGGIKTDGPPPKIGQDAVTPQSAARKRMTRILVSGASGHCTATIDDLDIVGKPNKKIAWMVEDGTSGCSAGKDWYIRLEFTTPWNNGRDQVVEIDRDDLEILKVHPNTPVTGADGHDYKVYLMYRQSGDDEKRLVIDPELDIEM